MDHIEKLSTRRLVQSRMVMVFFMSNYLIALVADEEVSAQAQFPCLLGEISKVGSLFSPFEQQEKALLDWVRLPTDTPARRHK